VDQLHPLFFFNKFESFSKNSCDNFEERKHNRAYFVHFPIQTNIFGMTNKNNLVQKCKKSQNRKHISESYRRLFWNKMFSNINHWICISQAQANTYKFYNTVEHFPCFFVHLSWSASRRQQDYLACVCLRYGGRA